MTPVPTMSEAIDWSDVTKLEAVTKHDGVEPIIHVIETHDNERRVYYTSPSRGGLFDAYFTADGKQPDGDGKLFIRPRTPSTPPAEPSVTPDAFGADELEMLYERDIETLRIIDATIDCTLAMVADQLGVTQYEGGDGTGELWSDVGTSVSNLLAASRAAKADEREADIDRERARALRERDHAEGKMPTFGAAPAAPSQAAAVKAWSFADAIEREASKRDRQRVEFADHGDKEGARMAAFQASTLRAVAAIARATL